jgi:orotate phosphoribosyltransferase
MTSNTNQAERFAKRTHAMLEESGALRTGHFLLSSGLHSECYCQCAKLFEEPDHAEEAAYMMAELLVDIQADVVLAPALGGVVWGFALADAMCLRSIFAERGVDRAFTLRRGFQLNRDERVLLAEDVVTTGGSVMELVPLVERAGAQAVGIAAIVDRSGGSFAPEAPFFALTQLSFETFEPSDCPMCAAGSVAEKPGSRPGREELS